MAYDKIKFPEFGSKITANADGSLNVPDCPYIAFIEGDGIGPDITKASMAIWNAAVEKAYGGNARSHGQKSMPVKNPSIFTAKVSGFPQKLWRL